MTLADDVYYERRLRESSTIPLNSWAWPLDRFLKNFTGYGVRLHLLLWLIVPILLIGGFIFHLEGAVVLGCDGCSPLGLEPHESYLEPLWVSLNIFLPIDIPSGADWGPSSRIIPLVGLKFTTIATILNLAGWILVPLGVAGISGLLKGSKKQ